MRRTQLDQNCRNGSLKPLKERRKLHEGRCLYGSLEIVVGLFLAFGALGITDQLTPTSTQLAQKLVSLEVLKFMTAVYVIIRGLVNLTEDPPKSRKDEQESREAPHEALSA